MKLMWMFFRLYLIRKRLSEYRRTTAPKGVWLNGTTSHCLVGGAAVGYVRKTGIRRVKSRQRTIAQSQRFLSLFVPDSSKADFSADLL